MNPYVLTACALLQVVVLYAASGSESGLGYAAGAVCLFAVFAFTRERWDAHVDMLLLMAGPGGLGMMLAGPACHLDLTWTHYLVMSAGMLTLSLPWCWTSARCIQQARRDGYAGVALLLDLAGMQIGMALAHLPMSVLPAAGPHSIWLQHALMLVGMLLGMMAGMAALRYWYAPALAYDDPRLL